MRDTLIPGVHHRLWRSIASRLQAPDFRYTRKLGLLYEPCIPDITSQLKVILVVDPRRDNCLLYFFGETIKKKRLRPSFTHLCPNCYGDDIRIHLAEAVSICGNCGCIQDYFDGTCSSYSQSVGPIASMGSRIQIHPRQHSTCFYKRKTHFKYWLSRIQGKESNRVTAQVLRDVQLEIDKFHDIPNYDSIRRALKRLKLQRLYNNTYSIQRSLIGHGLLELSHKQEEKLVRLFIRIQIPFASHADTRVNMIYYSYLIRKLAEILHWPSVAQAMPVLKSVSKTRQLDILWAKICKDLGFPFIRTV